MPTLPARAAAYTRTGILKRFLDQLSDADPGRVDNAYAESRMGLKGGDVRAFLQSLRVLGLIDPYGQTTDRARRLRASAGRGTLIREALREAYPELVIQWDISGGMPRDDVEDFFKVQYGLSSSSAGPAAKLFCDLMSEYGRRTEAAPRAVEPPPYPSASFETREATLSPPEPRLPEPDRYAAPSPPVGSSGDVRLAALDAIKSSLRIDINAEWDEGKIGLVFDRMERLVDRILTGH